MEHLPAAVTQQPGTGGDEPGVDLVEEAETWAPDIDASDVDVTDIDGPDVDAPDADGPALDSSDIDVSSLDTVEERLADVERALVRLDEGTYGTCEVCGTTVDDAVLVDAPATRYCPDHLPISFS